MVSQNWIGRYCPNGAAFSPLRVIETTVTFASGTTGAVAAKRLFTGTGGAYVSIIPQVLSSGVTTTGSGTISFGTTSNTTIFLPAIGVQTLLKDRLLLSASGAAFYQETDAVPQWVWVNNQNVIYTVGTALLNGGQIKVYCLYQPLTDEASFEPATVNQAAA